MIYIKKSVSTLGGKANQASPQCTGASALSSPTRR